MKNVQREYVTKEHPGPTLRGPDDMPPLGAHMSIAGGYYKSVEAARAAGCDCVQIFSKNNNQWRAKPITDEEAAKFKAALAALNIVHPLVHDSYLINLASPDEALWNKSLDAFTEELERADKLGIPYLVAHPGAFTTSSEEQGIARVAAALDQVHQRTPRVRTKTLLENTAGQGSCLGWRFEQLAEMICRAADKSRLGVCIDTCHTFAAGYPLAERQDYERTIVELDRVIGLDRVHAIHLNDSKGGLGSRLDRHEHIGRGKLGLEAFRHLLNDPRFGHVPMYLETAKEKNDDGEEMDVVNLRTLRSLLSPSYPGTQTTGA